MVVYMDGTARCGASGVENVTRFEREIPADVGNKLVHFVEHVARTALLHGLTVDVEVEMQGLNVTKLVQTDPLTEGRRSVKTFAKLPRLARLTEFLLQFASRKVNAHRHGIIVTGRKTLGNGLAQLAMRTTISASYSIRPS